MHETISDVDIKRDFARVLERVREGHSFVVTSHGCAVAHIVPIAPRARVAAAAKAALLARLERQPILEVSHWTRDELYLDESSTT